MGVEGGREGGREGRTKKANVVRQTVSITHPSSLALAPSGINNKGRKEGIKEGRKEGDKRSPNYHAAPLDSIPTSFGLASLNRREEDGMRSPFIHGEVGRGVLHPESKVWCVCGKRGEIQLHNYLAKKIIYHVRVGRFRFRFLFRFRFGSVVFFRFPGSLRFQNHILNDLMSHIST